MSGAEIPANVLGIITFSWKVSAFIWQSIEEIRDLPVTLRLFEQCLRSLGEALEQVQALNDDGMTTEERRHYEVVETISKECYKVVCQLEADLPTLERDPSVFKRALVVLERRLNENEIREKTNAIQRYTETIQVSLHALQLRKLNMLGDSIEEILRRVQNIDNQMPAAPPTDEGVNNTKTSSHDEVLRDPKVHAEWVESIRDVTFSASTMPTTPDISSPASPISFLPPINIGHPGISRGGSPPASSEHTSGLTRGSTRLSRRDSFGFLISRRANPPRPRMASVQVDEAVLELTERSVKDCVSRKFYSEAAKQQKECVALRRNLAIALSRSFPLDEELDMQERQAEFLLKCPTVAKREMAFNILRNLLLRRKDLPGEEDASPRVGRIHYWLAWLLVRPAGQRSLGSMEDAQTHSLKAIRMLELSDLNLAVKSREILVYALRKEGKELLATGWETWPPGDRGFVSSDILDTEVVRTNSNRRHSEVSTPGWDKACPGSVDVLEWCYNLHKESCPKDCIRHHVDPYTNQFSFDGFIFDNGQSLFDIAVRTGKTAIVQEMLPEVNLKERWHVLFLAASALKPNVIKILLSHRIPLDNFDPTTQTSILHHCLDSETVTNLLLNAVLSSFTAEKAASLVNHPEPKDGRTPLYLACCKANVRVVTTLLSRGDADPNIGDRFGKTPLNCAVEIPDDRNKPGEGARIRITRELLANGARPSVPDNCEITPLYTAAQKGYADVVGEILTAVGYASPSLSSRSASSSNNSRRTTFSSTSSSPYTRHNYDDYEDERAAGGLKAMDPSRRRQQLLDKRVIGSGETPLIAAVKGHHIEVVQRLVAAGASPGLVDKDGRDAWAHASGRRKGELHRALRGS